MIAMIEAKLNLRQLHDDLAALDKLLLDNAELNETGPGSLPECSVLQEFRADYAMANKDRSKFLFVEFEDAKKDSIFTTKTSSPSHTSFQWSPRFEHGYSQIVDWYFRLDDYQKTSKIEEHFGAAKMDYVGILVLGRDRFLKNAGLTQRFTWRRAHTVINSQHLHCFTFDELARELRGSYDTLMDLAEAP